MYEMAANHTFVNWSERAAQFARSVSHRDLLASLSLANLCFLNVWIELSSTAHHYYRKTPPRAGMILATAINVLLLGFFFFLCAKVVRRVRNVYVTAFGQVCLIAVVLVAANIFRKTDVTLSRIQFRPSLAAGGTVVVLIGLACLLAALSIWRRELISRALLSVLLLLSPLFIIFAGRAIWTQLRRPPDEDFAARTGPPRPSLAAPQRGPRIIWLMFDEWDYRLVFGARPKGVFLPELDRIVGQAVSATAAVGGGYGTANAVPSMLIGQRTIKSQTAGPRELLLRLDPRTARVRDNSSPGDLTRWSAQPSIFTGLRAAGWTSSVVGWYHPYCRVLDSQLDMCTWEPGASIYERKEYSRELSVGESMRIIAARQAAKVPLLAALGLVHPQRVRRELLVEEFKRIREAARAAIESADFVYVHWPIPHPFGIYDAETGRVGAYDRATYLDNLVLVDRILGEFRSDLERAGKWDNAIVLLSSDHSLRVGEWSGFRTWSRREAEATGGERSPYVPFLVKLAGEDRGFTYDQPFSILLTHDLILALAREEIRTPDELRNWLDANRGRFPLKVGGKTVRGESGEDPE
jgi:hypothetical protein